MHCDRCLEGEIPGALRTCVEGFVFREAPLLRCGLARDLKVEEKGKGYSRRRERHVQWPCGGHFSGLKKAIPLDSARGEMGGQSGSGLTSMHPREEETKPPFNPGELTEGLVWSLWASVLLSRSSCCKQQSRISCLSGGGEEASPGDRVETGPLFLLHFLRALCLLAPGRLAGCPPPVFLYLMSGWVMSSLLTRLETCPISADL